MFPHILRIAWRNIRRSPTYSLVTIAGLSLGICTCICIYTITHYEFNFDTFHPDGKRIYRVVGELTEPTGEKERFMVQPAAALQYGHTRITGVEALAGIINFNATVNIPVQVGSSAPKKASRFVGAQAAITEGSYFDVFSYDWLAGDRRHSMDRPNMVVLTEARAKLYFGAMPPGEYLGKQLLYDDSLPVTVSGIIKDWDQNTDLPFTDFVSYPTIAGSFLANWYHMTGWTRPDLSTSIWMKLAKGTRPAAVDAQLAELVHTHADPSMRWKLSLQPLGEMHFDSGIYENHIRTAHRPTLYGLILIALAILTLAIVNFVNLSTAYSLQRTKEVGLRKALGGSRVDLMVQFLSESSLLIVLAAGIAILLVNPALAAFRAYLPPGVHFRLLTWPTVWFFIALLGSITVLAGLYPARVASAHSPMTRRQSEKGLVRRGLIVLQFTVSLVFIMGSILISDQLHYVRNKDLGFSSDAIVELGIVPRDSLIHVRTMEEMLRKVPGVEDVTRQWLAPMTGNARGMKLKFAGSQVGEVWVTQVDGDQHYIPLYGIRVLAGRDLLPGDSVTEMVINETLARQMGCRNPGQALEKTLYWNDRPYPVVGVVEDFHTLSLHEPIAPVCMINRADREFSLAVKLDTKGRSATGLKTTLARMQHVWRQLYPAGTWNYQFYDETLTLLYENDRRIETLINVALGLSIFISCIGLFGLTLFTVEKRAKEISIRRVLGARVAGVVVLLCREVLGLVGIALLVASPLAWWLMSGWLRGFAYHVAIGLWVFLPAGMVAVGVALLTVGLQVVRAAKANPIINLRSE